MRIVIFAFIVCSGIFPVLTSGQTQCQTQFDTCVNNTELRSSVEPQVSQGANDLLNAIRTFANLGTGVFDLLSVPAGSRLPVGEVISNVLPDVLRYLSNVNVTYLEPYIANASQFIDDLVYDILSFNLSNPEPSISKLVYTLDRGIEIILDILRLPFNDPSIGSIINQIESIRNIEGFLDNVTCILLNIIQDPNIEIIIAQSEQISSVISDIKYLAAPIAQLFRNSTRFMDKFEQIAEQLSTSSGTQLCVDSFLTNLICPQFLGLSSDICNGACTDTLRYCSAFLFQSLDDFSDVLDAVALLIFEEVKSTEFEAIYNDLIASSVEIVNTTLFALADLDYIGLINNTITTCRTEFIISAVLQSLNVTIPPEQVGMILSGIPANIFENLTNFSDMYQNITQTMLPYQNIRYQIGLITLPNGFLLNSLFSIAIQNILAYSPPGGCFDPNNIFLTSTPLVLPFHSPNYFNCWNGTAVSNTFFTFQSQIDSNPFNVINNPAATRTCSFSFTNFQNARIYTEIDLCDEFANVIFGAPRTANFLASILSNYPFSLQTCQYNILQLLSQANVTIPTPTSPPTTMPPVDCISNECTNSTPARPDITVQLNDGAEYIVETARTVANLGTSLSDLIDNIEDRNALEEFLGSTFSSVLTNLGGINDTDLQPLYGELFSFANDFFYHIFVNFSSESTETVSNLIELLESGLDIAENLTRVIVGNDPNISFVFDLIEGVVSTPRFKENLTCILTEVFSNPNIATILSQLESIDYLTQFVSLSQPILQLFSDSEIFMNKFNELIAQLPNSQALSLCVDSYLANLFCPSQSEYCQDNCVDTLNYCTSYLFYSLQDFSDVLDAVLLLAAGHVETPEFESFFNQFRGELFNTIEITLGAVRTLDILGLVNTTLRNCDTSFLIGGILSQLPLPDLPPLNSSDAIIGLIDSAVGGILANFTIPPTPEVLAILNQTIQLSGLRNLTRTLYFYQDGFLLNGVLSLSVYYTMISRPPMGCGYSIGMQGPLSYVLYNNFLTSCWNGETFLNSSSITNQFPFGPPYYDYSSNSIIFNRAALRTCSFSRYSYQYFAINTNTNLCTIFTSIDSQSQAILQSAVTNFGRLDYCRDFIGNFSITTTPFSTATPPPGTQCETQFNNCVNNTEIRNFVEPQVSQGASDLLNAIRTFSNLGSGLYDLLSVPAGSRLPVGEVISNVLPDVLRYLSNVNVTYLEPYIANASQFIDDLVYDILSFNLNNPEPSISKLVYTLDRGIEIILDILRLPFNDPSIGSIINQIESIRNIEGFLDNVTCILLNIIQDPNIEIIIAQSEQISSVIFDIKNLAAPIAQLFRNSTRFMDKFEQIAEQLSTSSGTQLCVDSFLTNLICPQFLGLSSDICNGACTDTLRYCSAFLFQSLDDFSDVLDAVALLIFEEVKSTEFEAIYNDLIASSVEIVNTTLFALADLDYIGLINNTITTCRTEFIISAVFRSLNVTIPPEQVGMILSGIPANIFENLTNFSDMYQNITQTMLPYQNIRYQIGLITLPNGFLLNSLFSIAIQNILAYSPPGGCFDPNNIFLTSTPLVLPFHSPNYFNCWNGTAVSNTFSFTFQSQIDSNPFNVINNPAATRTCSFSFTNFQNARIYTEIDLCDEFANVIFGAPRTANFLASILSDYPSSLPTCRFTILQLLSQPNVTIPTTTSPPTTMQPVDCISNECTTSTPYRPNITTQLNDGAEYIVETARTVANLGTSLSDLIDNIEDRNALEEFLGSTFSSVLTNLGGINDTDLQPLYGELFSFANDFFYHIFVNFSSESTETVSNLIELLERGLDIAENLTPVIVGNDPNISFVFDLIEGVVSTPRFKENLTCILTEVFSNPNIATILSQLESIDYLTQFVSLSQPILQVFSDSEIFMNKFNELIAQLPNSQALSFCVDSYLANLFCTSENVFCQDNCVDTLNYCTSYLFYSLQDFSDVLDAVLLLAAGHVETPEFESFFNQFRGELFNTIEITLGAVRTLDILGLVNTTLRNCDTSFLIGGILSQLPLPDLPPLNSSDAIIGLIDSAVGGILANFTIPPTPEVLAILNQTIQLSGLRNLTRTLYFYQDGFLLNGVLSLSVYYTMISRPPMGCGYPIGMQGPLSYVLYNNFLTFCWNGDALLNSNGIPNQFLFGPPYYDYSSDSITFNRAALRTCSFSQYSYQDFAINTSTNLCTIFSSIDSQSRMILQDAVSLYGRLNYCRIFTGNFTSTTPTTPTTTLSTTSSATPLIAPVVSFQLNIYFASTNVEISIICRGIGTNVQFSIDSMTNFTIMDPMLATQRRILTFIFSTPGNYSLTCRGSNPAGISISRTIVIVRSLNENIDAIANIQPDTVLNEEEAMELLSVTGSLASSEEVQNNATVAQQLSNTASAIVSSLANSTNISTDTAGALLGLLETVESSPALDITPTQPPGTQEEEILQVSQVTIMVSRAIDSISLNLANQAILGDPPIIVVSATTTIAAAVVERTGTMSEFMLSGLPNTVVRIPLGGFSLSARIQIGAAQRSSSKRVQAPPEGTVPVSASPVLNSDLFNLNINMDGIRVTILTEAVTFVLQTSAIPDNGENICTFLNEETRTFIRGNVMTIPGGVDQSCNTTHLTSFGVLVRAQGVMLSEAETLAISIVSYILLSISLIFLLVSLILFLISARSFFKVETNILYFNFAVALTLATSVFIFGIQSARNSLIGCNIVGFLMHYTWLSVFSWSFAISLFMIYVLYFGILNRKKIWWLMMIIGWGLPLPIVIITIAVGASRNQYINIGDHCFLSYVDGLIWAFLAPFIILIIASSVGAILALIKISLTLRNKGDRPPSFAMVVNLVVTILVLLPVLSIPWIIGIVNAFITAAIATTVIEWVTVLFTAPVGVLFFFLVVLRNPQVQEVIFRRKVTHVSQKDTQSSGAISSKYTLPKAHQSEKFTESANVAFPTTFENPTYETSTTVLLPGDEDSASKEKEALRKTYDTETTVKKGSEASSKNVYTTLDTLATNKD